MTAHVHPEQFFFPASLPCAAVGLKLARECVVPSDCAALSATLQLSAIVRGRAGQKGQWLELRRLARQVSAAGRVIGRPA